MAVVSYPYPAQECAHAGPTPTTRPRHYVADGASTIANVDGAAPEGSTAAVNGVIYVKDASGNWDPITGGTNYLELIENKEFGSAATSYDFSSLDGDADGQYYIEYRIVKGAAGAQTTYLRPNAATTNQRTRAQYVGSAGTGTLNDTGGLLVSNNGSGSTGAGEIDAGTISIQAKSGANRTAEWRWTQSTAGDLFCVTAGWHWTDTAANITSLRLISTLANNIGIGSYLRLYRVKKA